jgi:predicted nucleic acid-binding protein
MTKPRLYLETSVWNFIFADDAPEKKQITLAFFDKVKEGEYEIFISDTVIQEIERADEDKKRLLLETIEQYKPKILEINDDAGRIALEYISEGIIPQTKLDDATHAAVATVHRLDALISWNLRHLANYKKMERINEVNMENGYSKRLDLITPMEVSDAEI